MRILVFPHSLAIGGSQLNAIELAAAVRDRGHDVTIFAAETGSLADTIRRLGLPLIIGPRPGRRPSFRIARALAATCREQRIDVAHGYEWPPCLESFYGPRLTAGAVAGGTIMSMAVAPFIPRAVPLIVGTREIAEAARRTRGGQVDVIEPPVDTVSNHPGIPAQDFRAAHGLGDELTIVVVSRLALELKMEGLQRAIRCASILAAETPLRLLIVGDGPARPQLEREAGEVNARFGRPVIALTGELSDPRPAYAVADLVLGMGGSALRAMAFAKPLIVLGERGFAQLLTPETAAIFEWQGFYGLGTGDTSPEPLAALIRPLLKDSSLRITLGQFSRSLVDSRFSLRAAAQRQEELYRAWVAAPRQRDAAVDGLRSAVQVTMHNARRRLARLRGRSSSEDFNTVEKIAASAALARGDPPMGASE